MMRHIGLNGWGMLKGIFWTESTSNVGLNSLVMLERV